MSLHLHLLDGNFFNPTTTTDVKQVWSNVSDAEHPVLYLLGLKPEVSRAI